MRDQTSQLTRFYSGQYEIDFCYVIRFVINVFEHVYFVLLWVCSSSSSISKFHEILSLPDCGHVDEIQAHQHMLKDEVQLSSRSQTEHWEGHRCIRGDGIKQSLPWDEISFV